MESQQDMMEAFSRFQTLQKQAEVYNENYQELVENMNELEQTADAIDEVKQAAEGKEVLVPLGSGAFARATIASVDEVIVGLGGDVFVEEPVDEAADTIQQRQSALKQAQDDLQEKIQETAEELEELMPKIREMQQQLGATQ